MAKAAIHLLVGLVSFCLWCRKPTSEQYLFASIEFLVTSSIMSPANPFAKAPVYAALYSYLVVLVCPVFMLSLFVTVGLYYRNHRGKFFAKILYYVVFFSYVSYLLRAMMIWFHILNNKRVKLVEFQNVLFNWNDLEVLSRTLCCDICSTNWNTSSRFQYNLLQRLVQCTTLAYLFCLGSFSSFHHSPYSSVHFNFPACTLSYIMASYNAQMKQNL